MVFDVVLCHCTENSFEGIKLASGWLMISDGYDVREIIELVEQNVDMESSERLLGLECYQA